ncbi:MAG: LysR family transcriptional regulator [Tagaea sp.]|nr:LysR family transcriptional regulator [Tagaea sp.]
MDVPTAAEIEGFLALFDEGSVSAAAKRLKVSQPAMSATLARLRRRFGDPLFAKAGRQMVPTLRAERLLPDIVRLRETVRSLSAPAPKFDPVTAKGRLVVAASDYSQAVLLSRFATGLSAAAPGIALEFKALDWDNLREQLERRRIDLAIVPRVDAWPELRSLALFEESFVCAARAGHPVKTLTLDRYCAAAHLSVVPGARPLASAIDKTLAEMGRQRRIALTVGGFLVVPQLLAATDWLATIPARLATLFAPGIVARKLPFAAPSFVMAAVWHARSERDLLSRWARRTLADLAARGG